MQSKIIVDDSLPGVKVVVRPATYRMGLLRTILIEQERRERGEQIDTNDPVQLSDAVGKAMIYPSLMAAVSEHEGFDHWPLTADEVIDLPEGFVIAWEQAAFSLNPQWRSSPVTEESAEKKV